MLVSVAAPETVTLPPPTACRKALPEPPETASAPKVRVPPELFWNEMLSVPPVTEVLPKFRSAVVVPMSMPCVVEPETLVVPREKALPPAPSESATPEKLHALSGAGGRRHASEAASDGERAGRKVERLTCAVKDDVGRRRVADYEA